MEVFSTWVMVFSLGALLCVMAVIAFGASAVVNYLREEGIWPASFNSTTK